MAPDGQRQTKTSGVPLSWLRANFGQCPAEADEATVQRYCRAYVLYIFGSILFPDSGGDMASWMWLPLLADWDEAGTFSWGSAALAWLYRQLCDACRRQGGDANLAGCVWLLQVSSRMLCFITFQFLANMLEANVCDAGLDVDEASSWSAHVEDPSGLAAPGCRPTSHCSSPVGIGPISSSRPQEFGVLPLHKRDGLPTARTCKLFGVLSHMKMVSYYIVLTVLQCVLFLLLQVVWMPYQAQEVLELELNPMCHIEDALKTLRCPLICFYAVEFQMCHRVMRQFGRLQTIPHRFSTSIDLHKLVISLNNLFCLTNQSLQHLLHI